MSKQLAFASRGAVANPIENIIGDLLAVYSVNGYLPDRGEIITELVAYGRSSSVEEDVKQILAGVESIIRANENGESRFPRKAARQEGRSLPDAAIPVREQVGTSPYDLCLAYSLGDLEERALVSALEDFAYTEPAASYDEADGAWPNSWQEVEDAHSDRLIGRALFAIVAAGRSQQIRAGSGRLNDLDKL